MTAISAQRGCLRVLVAALTCGVAYDASAYSCPQTPSPPRTETYQGFLGRVYELNGQELPYRLFVPEDYDPGTAYPLVLYLHHAGLAGSDQNNDSGWDNCVQLTSEIGSGNDYGGVFTHQAVDEDGQRFDTQERYPHFLLAPHANNSNYGFGGGGPGSATGSEHATRPLVWGILEEVQAEFNIDPGRLYVTGISMGCYGTWDIIMRSPGVFAAASPQSCRGDPNQTLLAELRDMPIWSMCGTNDSYFDGAQAMADGMDAVGATAFTFTAMQGVGHSINDRGYDYPGFVDWMFAQRLPGTEPPMGGSGGQAGAGGVAGSAGASGAGGVAGSAGASAGGGSAGAGNAGGGSAGDAAMAGGAAATSGASSATGGTTGGADPVGGMSSGGQATSSGGNPGSGGTPVSQGGSSGVSSGGGFVVTVTGGMAAVQRQPAESTESGCSCRVLPATRTSPGVGLGLLLLGALGCRRRRGGWPSIMSRGV